MRTIVVLLTLCLLISTSWAADHVVQAGQTWQNIAEATGNRIEALQAMNLGIDTLQANQPIRFISKGNLEELKYMFEYEYGGLRSSPLWTDMFPNGQSRARRLEPQDLLTLFMVEDARLWCQKMLRELAEADADYQYYYQCRLLLEEKHIWRTKPPSPPGYIVYSEIYQLAELWRAYARYQIP